MTGGIWGSATREAAGPDLFPHNYPTCSAHTPKGERMATIEEHYANHTPDQLDEDAAIIERRVRQSRMFTSEGYGQYQALNLAAWLRKRAAELREES